ncbi:MAG TPA: FeoB-associated Cys-rich membrane protein [Lachnospiraceae bacterium]|nr:FeoB-associated Cys-rich membrane protein [Lachnospiraceae bacterium]
MGTFLVGVMLLTVIGFIVKGMIKDKKAGKSVVCGGDCKHCGGHCSH